MKKRKVIWDDEAKIYFRKSILYIRKTSVQGADKVKKDVLTSTKSLVDIPERQHTLDKYRINNDGNHRAYEIHKYRISSYISKTDIHIVRIPHTSMKPQSY